MGHLGVGIHRLSSAERVVVNTKIATMEAGGNNAKTEHHSTTPEIEGTRNHHTRRRLRDLVRAIGTNPSLGAFAKIGRHITREQKSPDVGGNGGSAGEKSASCIRPGEDREEALTVDDRLESHLID